MSRQFSIYLDLMRVIAAFAVLIGHLLIQRFHNLGETVVDRYDFGPDAVIMFFVLSGFVIARSADRRDGGARRFLFNRATRIYSVAIPALLLTALADAAGRSLDPAAYLAATVGQTTLAQYFAYGTTLAHEWAGQGHRIGSNGPFWSLSYEVAYYLLFCAAIFTRGGLRVALLCGGALVAGVKVMLLAPAWVVGALVYRWARAGRGDSPLHIPIAIGAPVAYAVCVWTGLAADLRLISEALGGRLLEVDLRDARRFLWFYVVAILFALHLGAVRALMQSGGGVIGRALTAAETPIRWLAGGTFSLYLVHFPVIVLLDVALDGALGVTVAEPFRIAFIAAATIVVSYVFAEVFERPLGAIRRRLGSALGRRRLTPRLPY